MTSPTVDFEHTLCKVPLEVSEVEVKSEINYGTLSAKCYSQLRN